MPNYIHNSMWPGWETVRLIGRGSFGAVYEIQRDVFGEVEKAALKVITIPQNPSDIDEMYNDGYGEDDITETLQSHLKSIVAEYSLMRKLNGNTNIVHCEDVRYVQHADGIGWDIFIKMELLTPLVKALGDTVSDELVIKVAKDMCAALEVCREHNVLHRDIKPQNIFVSDKGDFKLGDFGIAKTVEKTMGGTKIGTYKYMAPEVYNNQPYGTAADIYSLGLVLYWLLNERRMPFMPLPPIKLTAGMEEDARNCRFSGKAIPEPKNGSEELKRIVLKACAFDPKERYVSAAEMLGALNHIGVDDEDVNGFSPMSNEVGEESEPECDPTPKPQPIPVVESVPDPAPKHESKTVSVPKKKRKRKLLFGAGAILLVSVLVLMWPVYGPWSAWAEQKPTDADGIKVESMNEYRVRNAVLLEANEELLPVGAEVLEQRKVWSDYSDWSPWQEEAVSEDESCQVESQVMYSSRKKTVTEEWSDWGDWSDWSTKEVSESDNRQVESRAVYYYNGYRYRCKICGSVFAEFNIGMVSHANQMHNSEAGSSNYSGGNLTQIDIDNLYSLLKGRPVDGKTRDAVLNDAGYVYETKTVTSKNQVLSLDVYSGGDGVYSYDNWFFLGAEYNKQERQYRTCTRSKVNVETWTDWSEYVTEAPVEADDMEIKTRTVYRYRTRKLETLYQYRSWGNWSDWGIDIPNGSAEADIEQRTVYRYAEQMPLWKLLLGTNAEQNEKSNPYVDVDEKESGFDAIMWATENGIMNGTSADIFDPNGTVTRGQMVMMLWRSAGKPVPEAAECPYQDVPEESVYHDAVMWATQEGIAGGSTADRFGVDTVCNRGQAITFLYRAAGKSEIAITQEPFTDVEPGAFYYEPVLWAYEHSISSGISSTEFGIDAECTRVQIAVMLYRTFSK